MDKLVMKSYAKINLMLEVLNRRPDGYHELVTIMQGLELHDVLIFENMDEGIAIASNWDIPLDSDNLVFQAWDLMKKYSGVDRGIKIDIEKNIPVGGGLGGGSSNAARTLVAINKLWCLGYTYRELEEIGSEIGADVPYFIRGGTVLAQGIGTELEGLKALKGIDILLVNPNINISTEEVYRDLKIKEDRRFSPVIVDLVEEGDIIQLSKKLYNDLEGNVIRDNPVIEEIKMKMVENGALGSMMSGSGSTVFGIFKNDEDLEYCKGKLENLYEDFMIIGTRTVG